MANLFKRLFGKKSSPPTKRAADVASNLLADFADVYDPHNEHDRMGLALLATIRPQLELLGYDLEAVPATEPFTSEKCRGSLAGLALGLLEAERIEISKDAIIDSLIAAFALVFSDALGRPLAIQTAEDIFDKVPDVMSASEWSRADVVGVYRSGGVTSASGFYLAAQGMI
jgi:hypothetical protein